MGAGLAEGQLSSGATSLDVEGAAPQHVVLVVLDTTHARHLGCYGGDVEVSPNLDALAARGVRFAEARSNTTWTLPSTVSLLTGLYQESHAVATARDVLPDDLPLLTNELQAAGFDVAFISQMIFASERHGFDRGVDHFVYHGKNRGAPEFHAAVRDRLGALPEGPSFTYLHYRRPHSPYDPAPEFLAPFEVGCSLADGSRDDVLRFIDGAADPQLDEAEVEHLRHLYRASLRQVDARLEQDVLSALSPRLSEDTLLVVTSDHGEGLGEHGDFGHGPRLFGEHVRVPLLWIGPMLRPSVIETPVSTVDVAPTLYELLGLESPGAMDGASLAAQMMGGQAPATRRAPVRLSGRWYPGQWPEVGVVGSGWTLLLSGEPGRESLQLFDRTHDPWELEPRGVADVPGDALREVEQMEKLARFIRSQRPPTAGPKTAPLSQEQEEELRRLGYLR